MDREPASVAQSSLEYLLLIAGAILVAAIVIILAIAFSPFGQEVFNTNLIEYNKIDLCTGQGAECSFSIDWGSGLTNYPPGVVIQNNSVWRTLVIRGVQLQLYCGDHICVPDGDFIDTTSNPYLSLTLPIYSPASSFCSSVGTNGYYSCTSCTLPGVRCGVNTTSLSFCTSNSPTQPCVREHDFASPAMITIPRGESAKVVIRDGRVFNQAITRIQINFKVERLTSDHRLVDPSYDLGQNLSMYTSRFNAVSEYYCASGDTNPPTGCTYGPGCGISTCNKNIPYIEEDYECSTPPQLVCLETNGQVSDFSAGSPNCSAYVLPSSHSLGSNKGVVYRMKFPNNGNIRFIDLISPGLTLQVEDEIFNPHTETNPGGCQSGFDCDDFCRTTFGPRFQDVKLYSLTPSSSTPSNQCTALFNATTTIDSTATMNGGCWTNDDGECVQPYCYATYKIPDGTLNAWAAQSDDVIIGIKNTGSETPPVIYSPYSDLYGPRLAGVYYTP